MLDTLLYIIYIYIGPVSIVNLQDITTQNDLENKNAVFAFDIHPRVSPDMRFGYSIQIQWSQLRVEFGNFHGTHTYYLPPEGVRNCGGTPNATFELVASGSYKLTVPTVMFGSGPLSISVSVSLACLHLTSYYCPVCSQWRYTSQASSIDISAKRGRTTCCSMLCVQYMQQYCAPLLLSLYRYISFLKKCI